MTKALLENSPRIPRSYLTVGFLSWKVLLFSVSLLSPCPGYDTSTTLLEGVGDSSLLPLIRWDAIYFTETAQRGYIFEQEWAFSWTLTRAMAFVAKYLQLVGVPPVTAPAWAGILIANASHFLAVLLLYELSLRIFGRGPKGGSLALVTAGLHIVSPAGIFLSAPNAESPFALFHILGILSYTESFLCRRNGAIVRSDLLLLLSGASIGVATALRSNGLISGFYFAYDAVREGSQVVQGIISLKRIRKLAVIVISGFLVALGFVLPQIVAYQEYCGSKSLKQRPWCSAMPPSIYTFVQEYYWNNGFLRYWTVSNIPLFALAGPILTIMIVSSMWGFNFSRFNVTAQEDKREDKTRSSSNKPVEDATTLLHIFAAPQAFITVFTLANGHVQIATRLSSGYPVWYWWIADLLMDESTKTKKSGWGAPKWITRWMVMYALIQAGLYSSFLPPA